PFCHERRYRDRYEEASDQQQEHTDAESLEVVSDRPVRSAGDPERGGAKDGSESSPQRPDAAADVAVSRSHRQDPPRTEASRHVGRGGLAIGSWSLSTICSRIYPYDSPT